MYKKRTQRKVGRKQRTLNPKQKKEVKKLISVRQELKYFSVTQASTPIPTTSVITDLTLIPQGITDQDRAGDRLMLCGRLEMRFRGSVAGGITGDIYDTIRFIVFQWHPNSVPVANNILINGPTGAIDVYSHYSHDNRQEFKILFDKTYTFVGNNVSALNAYAPNMTHMQDMHISLRKATKQLQYSGGTTAGTNHLYMLQLSDSVNATHPSTVWSGKVFYRDS